MQQNEIHSRKTLKRGSGDMSNTKQQYIEPNRFTGTNQSAQMQTDREFPERLSCPRPELRSGTWSPLTKVMDIIRVE